MFKTLKFNQLEVYTQILANNVASKTYQFAFFSLNSKVQTFENFHFQLILLKILSKMGLGMNFASDEKTVKLAYQNFNFISRSLTGILGILFTVGFLAIKYS